MISTETEGERVMNLITSFFHDVKYNGFKILGMNINQQNNGDYKLEFTLENNEELVEKQRQKKEEELRAVLDDPLGRVSE